jgi:hypothetical protein
VILTPTSDNFVNDIFTFAANNSINIVFCSLDESYQEVGDIAVVREILVEAQYTDSNGVVSSVKCPNIIGVLNSLVQIESDDPTMAGVKISKDNIGSWRVNINV